VELALRLEQARAVRARTVWGEFEAGSCFARQTAAVSMQAQTRRGRRSASTLGYRCRIGEAGGLVAMLR
jgi:hypothetical protein